MSLENFIHADFLATAQNLAPLSKFQRSQIVHFLQSFRSLGFPKTRDDVGTLSAHVKLYRDLHCITQSCKKEAKELLKRKLSKLPIDDLDGYTELVARIGRYLQKNYTRGDVVQSATLLQPALNEYIWLLKGQGVTKFGIAGSYGALLPRPDSDVDLAIYSEFPLEKTANNFAKEQIKALLDLGSFSAAKYRDKIDIWPVPQQLISSQPRLSVAYFSESINLIDLVPNEG